MYARWFVMVFFLLLAAVQCRPSLSTREPDVIQPTPPPNSTTSEPATTNGAVVTPIGVVARQDDRVEHGSGGVQQLALLEGVANLYEGDAIRVQEGGEALLDFGDALNLILFNESQMSVASKPNDNAPPVVQFFLYWGGFLGEKLPEEGGVVEVDTPNGARIIIAGTSFFVVYDDLLRQAAIGNFDGSVRLQVPGQTLNIDPGFFVMVDATGGVSAQLNIPLTKEQFLEGVRREQSALRVIELWQQSQLSRMVTSVPPAPSDTPALDASATPAVARATYLLNANCRAGPHISFQIERIYQAGDVVMVDGRNSDASWWRVRDGEIQCWSSDVVMDVENSHLVETVPVPSRPVVSEAPTATPSPLRTVSATFTLEPTPVEIIPTTDTHDNPNPTPTADDTLATPVTEPSATATTPSPTSTDTPPPITPPPYPNAGHT